MRAASRDHAAEPARRRVVAGATDQMMLFDTERLADLVEAWTGDLVARESALKRDPTRPDQWVMEPVKAVS